MRTEREREEGKREREKERERERERESSYEGKRPTVESAVRLRSTGNIYMSTGYQASYK